MKWEFSQSDTNAMENRVEMDTHTPKSTDHTGFLDPRFLGLLQYSAEGEVSHINHSFLYVTIRNMLSSTSVNWKWKYLDENTN